MSVLKFLSQQDYFGSTFHVTINGRERTKTLVGFFMSLSFVGLILFASIKFMTDYFSSSRPKVLLRDITNDDYPKIRLNQNSLNYFFLLKAPMGYVDPSLVSSYFNMTVYYERLDLLSNSQFNISYAYAGVLKCTELPWFNEKKGAIDSKIRTLIEKFGICANDSTADYLLYNGADPPYGHVELQFTKCVLTSGCATPAEVSVLEVDFGTVEHYFSASDYDEPLRLIGNIKSKIKINTNERKEYRFFANEIKVFSDTGFFTTSFSLASGFQLSNPKTDQRKLYKSDLSYLQILFYTSGRHIEYTRTYYKFLNLLSDIGGVIQIIAFVVGILYSRYNTYIQNKDLITKSLLGITTEPDPKKRESRRKNSKKLSFSVAKTPKPQKGDESPSKSRELEMKRIVSIKADSPFSPNSPGHDPRSRIRTFANMVESTKNRQLFTFDDLDFDSPLYLNLVGIRLLDPDNELMKKQAAFYSLCHLQLEKLRDIYEVLATQNEMSILRHFLLPPEVKPLLHYASLESRQASDSEQDNNISYRDAIKQLLTEEPSSPAQALLTEYMLARVKIFEKKFNGEVRNHMREIIKEIRRSPMHKQA